MTILNEDDDVNPFVQCKFCPWKGGAGATRIRQHILCHGRAAQCKDTGEEYNAMQSQLEKKPPHRSVTQWVTEASVKRACMAALQKEPRMSNSTQGGKCTHLRAHNAALACARRSCARACTGVEAVQMLPVTEMHAIRDRSIAHTRKRHSDP